MPVGEGWKLRGHVRYEICHLLAEGTLTQTQIAERYDVSAHAISNFNRDNRERIAEIRANMADEFAGMWIANKAKRVEVYQESAEWVSTVIEQQATLDPLLLPPILPALIRTQHNALKAAAEEMGAIPAKIQIQVQPVQVDYKINGVDIDQV